MDTNIDQLSFELEVINSKIGELTSQKHEKEREIIAALGEKNEGTTTRKSKFYKASTVAKVTRSIDKGAKYSDFVSTLGEETASRVIRVKYELVTSEFKNLSEAQQTALSEYVTSKPAKTAVKVERIEEVSQ